MITIRTVKVKPHAPKRRSENERTLEELFELMKEAIEEPYEVVRTIGFALKCKSRVREFRLEALKHPEEELSSVLIWEKGEDGAWRHDPLQGKPTLNRNHPD